MKKSVCFLLVFSFIIFLGACDDESNPVTGYPDTPYSKKLKSFTVPNDMIDSVMLSYGQDGRMDTTWAYVTNQGTPYIQRVTWSESVGDTIYDVERSLNIGWAQDTSYWKIVKEWEGQTKTLTYYYDTKTKGEETNVKQTISYTYEGSELRNVLIDDPNSKIEINLSGGNPNIMTMNTVDDDEPWLKDSIWAELHTFDRDNPYYEIDYLADWQIQTWFYMTLTPKLVDKAKFKVTIGNNQTIFNYDFTYEYDELGHPTEIEMESDNDWLGDYDMILDWE